MNRNLEHDVWSAVRWLYGAIALLFVLAAFQFWQMDRNDKQFKYGTDLAGKLHRGIYNLDRK